MMYSSVIVSFGKGIWFKFGFRFGFSPFALPVNVAADVRAWGGGAVQVCINVNIHT